MTRTPANSANADDSWEQLEADLFGIEVGKEHTAEERVASEPAPPAPQQVVISVPKPIEDDDFGDFGSGVIETSASAEPPRPSSPRSRSKAAKPAEPEPVKSLPVETVRGFDLADLDEGPTDEELDAASDEEDEEGETDGEGVAAAGAEDDPYWDALANWNWQEDDRSGKSRPESSRDRPRSGGSAGRGDSSQRGPRGRSGERRPPRESRPVSSEDRGHSTPRRPAPERDRGRGDEIPASVSDAPAMEREPRPVHEEQPHVPADVKSRRQDRRRSRRHSQPAEPVSDEAGVDQDRLEEIVDEGWPAAADIPRSLPVEQPRSRELPEDEDFEEDVTEASESSTEAAGDEERAPRRRRRRRRRRPERTGSVASESAADEDIKHLEDDSFESSEDEDLEPQSGAEELGDEDRPSRPRRPRRRRRGGRGERPERPAPAPAARIERDFDDDEDDEDIELVEAQVDDEFDEDQDREFVEEDRPARPSRRPPRARRSASETPFVRHVEDDDEEDVEPEPAISYEDVPSWEEAISYLLNPSMVEGAGGDRPERSGPSGERGHRGGERSSRPPRRGPRRDRDA